MESVSIRSFFGLYFPPFALNTERYGVFRVNAGKYRPEKLRIRTLFMHCILISAIIVRIVLYDVLVLNVSIDFLLFSKTKI